MPQCSEFPPTLEDVETAADWIIQGRLVCIPTETVYGLAADGLNREAVISVFTAKERPLTDPLILHVYSQEEALVHVELKTDFGRKCFRQMTDEFWPGPLSIICRGRDHIPNEVSAGTGFVAVRCPRHETCLQLLKKLRPRPLVAPSANKFSHVSTTSTKHVLDEFPDLDCFVLQGGECRVGIESTIVKIDEISEKIEIFRLGGVTKTDLERVIGFSPEVKQKFSIELDETQESSGRLLKHYAPNCLTCLVSVDESLSEDLVNTFDQISFKDSVVIDFLDYLSEFRGSSGHYISLSAKSCNASAEIAMAKIFSALREAELEVQKNPKLRQILIANFVPRQELEEALYDRVFRAVSGKHLVYSKITKIFKPLS